MHAANTIDTLSVIVKGVVIAVAVGNCIASDAAMTDTGVGGGVVLDLLMFFIWINKTIKIINDNKNRNTIAIMSTVFGVVGKTSSPSRHKA